MRRVSCNRKKVQERKEYKTGKVNEMRWPLWPSFIERKLSVLATFGVFFRNSNWHTDRRTEDWRALMLRCEDAFKKVEVALSRLAVSTLKGGKKHGSIKRDENNLSIMDAVKINHISSFLYRSQRTFYLLRLVSDSLFRKLNSNHGGSFTTPLNHFNFFALNQGPTLGF